MLAQPHNRGRKLPGQVYSVTELRALLQACNRGASGDRNRALIVLLWRAGLRVAEGLTLKPGDLDPKAGLVHVRNGKGRKPRTVGLDPEAFAVLGTWLEKRRHLGLNGRQTLFCTLQGAPMDSSYVRAMLKRVAARAGIKKRVHAHGLRHSHAVELIREGATLPEVKAQLGHSTLAVTSRYLDHVAPEDLAARMRARPSWR